VFVRHGVCVGVRGGREVCTSMLFGAKGQGHGHRQLAEACKHDWLMGTAC